MGKATRNKAARGAAPVLPPAAPAKAPSSGSIGFSLPRGRFLMVDAPAGWSRDCDRIFGEQFNELVQGVYLQGVRAELNDGSETRTNQLINVVMTNDQLIHATFFGDRIVSVPMGSAWTAELSGDWEDFVKSLVRTAFDAGQQSVVEVSAQRQAGEVVAHG